MGIDEDFTCAFIPKPVNFSNISGITIGEGHFVLNKGNILSSLRKRTLESKVKITIIGPIVIRNNWSISKFYYIFGLMMFTDMTVHINGPVIISHNGVEKGNILRFVSSEVFLSNKIIFEFNNCPQIVSLELKYTYIKIMEYTSITFIDNKCHNELIKVDNINKDDFCLFQFMEFNSKKSSTNNYAVTVNNKKMLIHVLSLQPQMSMATHCSIPKL